MTHITYWTLAANTTFEYYARDEGNGRKLMRQPLVHSQGFGYLQWNLGQG